MEYNTQTLITRDGKVITGVCAFLGKQNKIDICEENRIVLTPGEQKDEGGPQAYTLPLVVVDSKGNTLSNEILTKLIYKDIVGKKMRKLQKSLRKEKISRPDFDAKIAELESIMESGYTTDTNYAKIARAAGEKYKNRN